MWACSFFVIITQGTLVTIFFSVFIIFNCNCTVLYILFHLPQLMTVYPFVVFKELRQFMNMYATSLTVKTYFETVHDLSPQTTLMRYHVARTVQVYAPVRHGSL